MEFTIKFELIVFSIERIEDRDEVLVIWGGGATIGVGGGVGFVIASAKSMEIWDGGSREFDGLRKYAEIILAEAKGECVCKRGMCL